MSRRLAFTRGWRGIIALSLLGLLAAFQGFGAVPPARAQAAERQTSVGALTWNYQLDFSAGTASAASEQAYGIAPGLRRQGVTSFLQAIGGKNYRLAMAGTAGLDQLRQVLFSPLLAGFIGGPAEIEISLPPSSQPNLTLRLEANLGTGYRWYVTDADGYDPQGQAAFITRSRGYGVPDIQVLALQSTGGRVNVIHLEYRRSFGPQEIVTRHVQIVSTEPLESLDLSNPHPKTLSPVLESPGRLTTTDLGILLPASSPQIASMDWRSAGIVPPIRNQGACGSCWAFGTVGVMESAMAKIGAPMVDLSEQFLVSCNTYGWNCDNGGLTAHMWHYDTLGKNQTSIGAVLEADKPYTATNGSCTVDYAHSYSLSGWQFIVPDEWSMPTVEKIKTAISLYGPVTAGVCAGPLFQSYQGGIFTTNEDCGGWTNHQIILVGWKDTSPTEGYWILRNSWGPWWGEDGYMRIAYNTSRVGEGTSWVQYGERYEYYFPWINR